MKTRLGLLALVAILAGCSAQDKDTKSALQAGDSTLGTNAKAISGIAQYARDSKRSIGSAPDRGELFTYRPGVTALHEGAYTLRPVSLSEEHAIRAAVTGVMAIPGPDGKDIKIAYERHEEHPDGNWSWIGRVIGGDQAQEAIFTFGQDAVFGSIPQANGPSLKLTTQRGIAYLMQADASRLFHGYRVGNDVKVAAYRPSQTQGDSDSSDAFVEMATAKARATASTTVSTKAFTSANTIDLVAGYSNGLAARLGSDAAAVTRLTQLVVAANQALLNSKVNAYIRLVGAVKVNYADNTDNGVALDQLTGNDGENAVTVPAALAPLRAARETTGADLVTLVRDFQQTNNGCGIAWLLGANGRNIVPASDSPFGYSIVSDGDYDLNGNSYFCEDISLVHELAHNMGSAHDVGNAGGTPGRFPYSYGYKTTAAAGNFFTVMAYGEDNQTLYRVFSNPAITTCGTRACGVVNAADNARSLTQTIPIVSQFRSTVVPVEGWKATGGEVNNDGKDDLVFSNSDTYKVSFWLMNGLNPIQKSASRTTSPGDVLVANGDFNGDGKLDSAWVTSSNDLWIWSGNGSNLAASYAKVATLGAGWSVSAAGDVDGDGKDDLIFVNPSPNRYTYWIMNGTSIVRTGAATALGTGEVLAASGDFNGDGKLDLVWSKGLDFWMWLGNGTNLSATYKKIGAPGTGWTIKAAGDINANGKDDLVFVNSTGTNRYMYWIMNGTIVVSQSTAVNLATGDTLMTSGDFNGDNKLDLVWKTNSKDLWMWLGNGTKLSAQYGKIGNTSAL